MVTWVEVIYRVHPSGYCTIGGEGREEESWRETEAGETWVRDGRMRGTGKRRKPCYAASLSWSSFRNMLSEHSLSYYEYTNTFP